MKRRKRLLFGLVVSGVILGWLALVPGPAAAQISHQVLIGTPGNDPQITLRTPGRDFILQDRPGKIDTQPISGADRRDWLEQDGGDGNANPSIQVRQANDNRSIQVRQANALVHEISGRGNRPQIFYVGGGKDEIFQSGGAGNVRIRVNGGSP